MATIDDVAKRAGVSKGTVSSVFSKKADQPASDGAGTGGSPRAGIFPESSGPKPRDQEDDEHRPQDPSPA